VSHAEMSPTAPPAVSPKTPHDSTLRRNGAAIFGNAAFSSSNPFEADESEFEGGMPYSKTKTPNQRNKTKETTSNRPLAHHNSASPHDSSSKTPTGKAPTSGARMSTFRRMTADLLSGFSSNAFDPDEDEFDEATPGPPVRRNLFPAAFGQPPVRAKSTAAVSSISVEATVECTKGRNISAVDSLSKQALDVPPGAPLSSPGHSTFKRNSANFFSPSGNSSTSIWNDDDEEEKEAFAKRMEVMMKTRRVCGNALMYLRGSQTLIKGTASHTPDDKENADDDFKSQFLLPSQRTRGSLMASTGTSPLRPTRASPLQSVFESSEIADPAAIAPNTPRQSASADKSMWDANEDGFDRWPGQEELTGAVESFTLQHGTYLGIKRSEVGAQSTNQLARPGFILQDDKEDGDEDTVLAVRGANLAPEEHEDIMHELMDMNCGNPTGFDAHDEVMRQFFVSNCAALPASNPAGCPHAIIHDAYLTDQDTVVLHARPRLVDAVATVLLKTGAKCLADFLDPKVKVFEWRRDGKCLIIRRDGNEVLVGTFHNYGTCYIWTYFVKSEISETGAWKEVYAGTSLITTPVSGEGVQFDKWAADKTDCTINPEEEKFALYMGRCLGLCLLTRSVWDFRVWRRWNVEWVTDGVVTNARECSNNEIQRV
jgi:hypothetical protein